MDITLRQLRLLREVAARGTIAAAAEAHGYTASAVSQQLSSLEKATGVTVLERVGRNVRLTDAGRELVVHAGRLLAGMEEAMASVEQVNQDVRGVLHMSLYESVASTLLSPLLGRLADAHPDLELRTRQQDPFPAIEDLASTALDLAFVIDYPHTPEPHRVDIERMPLLVDRFHLVVAADSPIDAAAVELASLAEERFVSPMHGCARSVVMACRSAGFDPFTAHVHDDYPTALHLVAGGHGVALVPELGLVHKPDGVRVIPLVDDVTRNVQLAFRRASADRPAIRAVCEQAQLVVADLGFTAAAA